MSQPLTLPQRPLATFRPSGIVELLRRCRPFAGPALLVSVGYMDPGNWATDLQAGALYHYDLLWVVVLASAMAMVLQLLAARLGMVSGRNLAQACRDHYPASCAIPLWILCEIAIGACDLAEVLGSAVAINLLFGTPLMLAVLMTAGDVFLLLLLQRHGMRAIEAVVLVLVATIAGAFFMELFVLPATRPDLLELGRAVVHPTLSSAGMASIAVAIIGATVMPHNLYLHSALVSGDPASAAPRPAALKQALRMSTWATVVSLSLACLVNAAILVLAAQVFHGQQQISINGQHYALGDQTDWIQLAYLTFTPVVGSALASALFAVALLASGQSSTLTGTLAGQVVMEGFTRWHLDPWKRRMLTRALAIAPAVVIIGLRGDSSVNDLLILSQVVLALQLPFAMFPLLHFVSTRRHMGAWPTPRLLLALGWLSAVAITAFDLVGLPGSVADVLRILHGS
ncbi:Nramp family divalent metal transporter [Stenotrophomonas sp. PS02289]|uniref:Nramp family divalent metal transporter n=1 Tax=Stenotrophomonas sp. PS02289 TaxID=2991422 RepID=UPI00249A777A|nr:Nramp family divalent metal transporter [Stenotrophomonas sp. PS02289]